MQFKTDYQDQIEVRMLNQDFLHDISKTALNTVGKSAVQGKKITPLLLKKYLISEHSPIRSAVMETLFIKIYSPTSVHFARHVHSIPYVTTSREDRTGKARSLDTPVNHLALWNLQALIDMMRKRLCIGSCSADTYHWALSLKLKLMRSSDEYMTVIGQVLVPNCIYRCGCPEFKKCHIYQSALKELSFADLYQIEARYAAYNQSLLTNNKP